MWVHPTSKRVLRSVLEGPGGYSLRFEQPTSANGVPFARKVTFTDSTSTVVLRWNPGELELNEALDDALFKPTPPPGARPVEVEALPPGDATPPPSEGGRPGVEWA